VVRDNGGHVLLVLDTLAPLLTAWEEALDRAVSIRGKAIDDEFSATQRRSLFACLLERAASLARGGSLTLVGLVETSAMAAMVTPATTATIRRSGDATDDLSTSYSLADFAGRKDTELKRLQGMVDRGILLTDAALRKVGIRLPGDQNALGVAGEIAPDAMAVAVRELQSLSDGQIVLDDAAAKAGAFPAVEPGTTFSRFGLGGSSKVEGNVIANKQKIRDVRPPALQAVAAHLRVHLALEREAHFRPVSAGADSLQSSRMRAVRAALLQPPRAAMSSEEITSVLLAACSGALDTLPCEATFQALRGGSSSMLLRHLRESVPHIMEGIARSGRLDEKLVRELDVSVRLFAALRHADIAATEAASSPSSSSASPTASDMAADSAQVVT